MKRATTVVATLLLAACSGQGGNEATGNVTESNAAAGAERGGAEAGGAASVALQPGQWETTVEIVRMDMPNMPPGMSANVTPPPTTVGTCLTAEQAARPNANFLTGSGESGGCTTQDLSMANGRITGSVQCEAGGTQMRTALDGQFTPTGYTMNNRVQTVANGVTMDMETRTTARRTGDCPAG